jgi:hypothetical protein
MMHDQARLLPQPGSIANQQYFLRCANPVTKILIAVRYLRSWLHDVVLKLERSDDRFFRFNFTCPFRSGGGSVLPLGDPRYE